jgi:catechol 2,3-dioxygenase-like lactoylglutathione lyase family enzyme
MQLKRLDHVNVRTANLPAMIAWYGAVLDMHPGPRPPFSFNGAWLYCGEHPIVHLVEVAEPPRGVEPRLEHFAISAEGLSDFVARLEAKGERYEKGVVPGFGITQINVWDPDGNHIHIDFAPGDA